MTKPALCLRTTKVLLNGSAVSFLYTCIYEPRHEKTDILVSDRVRNKPDCTATEDS